MIPRYCPEWTDHNVSDPGVTLIELFAWMTDMLLYRVNQVPDKNYIKFLELIGIQLEAPRAARGPITFYLSAAQPAEIKISAGAEVATIRTETNPAIVFSTEEDLVIRPPVLTGAYTRNASHSDAAAWTTHDLRQLGVAKNRIALFPAKPGPGDAFYLSFSTDHTRHVLAVALNCDSAGGAGIDPKQPADGVGGLAGRADPLGKVRSGVRRHGRIQPRGRDHSARAADGAGRVSG